MPITDAYVAGYLYYLLFSPFPPGEPAINPDTEALLEIGHESLNLFYLNIWLDSLGVTPIPSIAEHPVAESIFNIIMGWSVMLLPAILADRRSEEVPQRYGAALKHVYVAYCGLVQDLQYCLLFHLSLYMLHCCMSSLLHRYKGKSPRAQ